MTAPAGKHFGKHDFDTYYLKYLIVKWKSGGYNKIRKLCYLAHGHLYAGGYFDMSSLEMGDEMNVI